MLQKCCRTSSSRFPHEIALRFVHTVVGDGCPSCKISSVLHGNTNSLSLLRMSTSCYLIFLTLELLTDPPYPPLKDRQSNFLSRSRRIQWIYQEGLVFRTDTLDLGFLMILVLDRILLLLQMERSAHQMVTWTVVHKVSGHLLVGLAHVGRSSNTPWLLPTSFLAVQTEPILTKFLLSLVVQLGLHFHLFRICAALIYHDFNSALRRLQMKKQRFVRIHGSWVFFLTSEFSGNSLRLFSWFWFFMDNFESIASHICDAI